MKEYICKEKVYEIGERFGYPVQETIWDLPTVELETVRDIVVPKLEKHNIKRCYPDMTDGEVATYILGFTEYEKLNIGHCYVDNEGYERCSVCNEHKTGMRYFSFCPRCGVNLKH